jgi:small subunit ribosomal protein S6e
MPAKFKCVISDPRTGRSEALELDGDKARPLLGLKIGDTIEGSAIGLSGQITLTGGTDRSGFPLRRGVHGAVKVQLIVGKTELTRRRGTIRGEMVAEDTYQLNLKRVIPAKEAAPAAPKEEEGGRGTGESAEEKG